MSTNVLMLGMSPFLVSRRRSDSMALRYWVGLTPKAAKARRQAATDGISASGVSYLLDDGSLFGHIGGSEFG